MKTGRRKIYWDTSVWLAWLNGEGTEVWPASVVDGIRNVVEIVENNEAILFSSAILKAEIYQGRLSSIQKELLDKILRRTNVTVVSADSRIMDKASQIREFHENEKVKRKIKTPDATHLATAILYQADEFQTMDGLSSSGASRKLLAISGNVGGHNLRVVNPYPINAIPSELITVDGPLFETFASDKLIEVVTESPRIDTTQMGNGETGTGQSSDRTKESQLMLGDGNTPTALK